MKKELVIIVSSTVVIILAIVFLCNRTHQNFLKQEVLETISYQDFDKVVREQEKKIREKCREGFPALITFNGEIICDPK